MFAGTFVVRMAKQIPGKASDSECAPNCSHEIDRVGYRPAEDHLGGRSDGEADESEAAHEDGEA